MKKKNKDICFYVLITLASALIITTFLVPIVRFKAIDNNDIVVADGVFRLLPYLKQLVYLTTDAFEIFLKGGPVWLCVMGLNLNFLVVIFGIVAILLCVFQLITKYNKSITAKQNNLTKRIVLFFGYFGLISQIFTIISFFITTLVSKGHATYIPSFECYISLALSLLIVIFGHVIKKDKFYQKDNNKTAMWGFAGCAISVLICTAFIFVPQISGIVLYGYDLTIYDFAMQANVIAGEMAPFGDYALGFSQYAIFATMISAIFVLIYSIIGFIRASKNKDVTWLSIRIKRWTMTFLIANTVLYSLIIGAVCACTSTTIIDSDFMFLITSLINTFIIFIPYIFATIVPLNKKEKQIKDKYIRI